MSATSGRQIATVRQIVQLLPTKAYNRGHFYMVRLVWFPGRAYYSYLYLLWELRANVNTRGARIFAQCVYPKLGQASSSYCFSSAPASFESCHLKCHCRFPGNDTPTFNGCSTIGLLSVVTFAIMNNDHPPAHKSSK